MEQRPSAIEVVFYRACVNRDMSKDGTSISLSDTPTDFPSDLPALIEGLVRLKVDAILAQSSSAALAVKQFTTAIPIVVVVMADPVRLGLIASEADVMNFLARRRCS